jgi:ABC-type protease/lipase transport system fused ATPase/permease subunit
VISHRPSLLADANLVAVVVDGQLQHFGARDEVLAKIIPKARPALIEVTRGTA